MSRLEQLYLILKSNGVSVADFIRYLNEHEEEVKEIFKNKENN